MFIRFVTYNIDLAHIIQEIATTSNSPTYSMQKKRRVRANNFFLEKSQNNNNNTLQLWEGRYSPFFLLFIKHQHSTWKKKSCATFLPWPWVPWCNKRTTIHPVFLYLYQLKSFHTVVEYTVAKKNFCKNLSSKMYCTFYFHWSTIFSSFFSFFHSNCKKYPTTCIHTCITCAILV